MDRGCVPCTCASPSGCEGEVIVIRPHLLARVHRGSYCLTSGKMKGRRKCWKIKMKKRRKVKLTKKVKEVRDNAQLMHATWWWPWDGMRRKRKPLEPMCDVQRMSVTTAKQRLTTKTATLRTCSCVPQVFWVAAHSVGFRVVLRVGLVLRVVNGVLVDVIAHSISIPNSCIFHIAKKRSFEVLSSHKSICNKIEWIRESHSSEVFRQRSVNNKSPRSIVILFCWISLNS